MRRYPIPYTRLNNRPNNKSTAEHNKPAVELVMGAVPQRVLNRTVICASHGLSNYTVIQLIPQLVALETGDSGGSKAGFLTIAGVIGDEMSVSQFSD